MHSCTVIILVCLLGAEAAPALRKGVKRSALNAGVEVLREDIKTILGHLDVPGQLPNISCLSLNYTDLVVPDQQLFTGQHLSTFRCYMLKMCELTSDLSNRLNEAIQNLYFLEQYVKAQPIDQDCTLPPLHQDMNFNVKCMLNLLDQHLSRETVFLDLSS